MKFKITAPDGRFNGEIAGAQFRGGVAEVEAPSAALSYCRRRGYTVERVDEQPKRDEQSDDGSGPGPVLCECEHSPCEHQQSEEEFDPGEHSVADVNEYLSGVDLKERERVLQAEAEGKSRLTVLNGPHSDLSGLK